MNVITLESVTSTLTTPQKALFFDVFWNAWSANGFGTLGKKDTELLLFVCLRHVIGTEGPDTNYDWARMLRVTPTRLKSMRLEAHLRFGHLFVENSEDEAKAFLRNFAKFQAIDLEGMETNGEVGSVK